MMDVWQLILNNILIPLGQAFGAAYNFIQTTPFFSKNLFNFICVVAFFIWLLFYKIDIISLFAKKAEETKNTIKNSENKKADAIVHLNNTKDSLKNIDSDVEKIIENAKDIAKTMSEKAEDKLKKELNSLEERTNILTKGYEHRVQSEVSKNIANAAIMVSKEYMQNSLDENAQKELIYNFINDLENMRAE